MIGGKDISAKYAENFRKCFQKVIQHPGKARALATSVFEEPVLDAGGIRFFVKFEQVSQLDDQGLDKIMSRILPVCKENKWSPESTENMLVEFGKGEKSAQLGMAMLEMAAVTDYGKNFAESCYTLEGDSAMILRGSAVFERLEETIGAECPLVKVNQIINSVLLLISQNRDIVSKKKSEAEDKCIDTLIDVNDAKDRIKALQSEKRNITGGTSQSGRKRQLTARATNEDALEKVNIKIIDEKVKLVQVKSRYEAEVIVRDESIENYNTWNDEFTCVTIEQLIDHAHSVGQPAIDYYNKLFNSESGDCFNVRQMTNAAKIFNPMFLAGKSEAEVVTVLHPLADKLMHFGYVQFTEDFITQLKNEIQKVVDEADKEHDLDRIKPSKLFKTRMEQRIKREKIDRDSILDWKLDDGEYSCRIWEWWRPKMTQFPCFALALRLVVLCQLSSCSVERVFSRLKLIQDVCGHNLYEDHLEMRLFLQCNGDLHEFMVAVQNYVQGL